MANWMEVAARTFETSNGKRRFARPGDLASHLNPKVIQTPAFDLIDDALVEAFETPDSRTMIFLAPQEGKSTRVAEVFPLWVLSQSPDTRIVTALTW